MLIDFRTLFPKYAIKPKGVLHVGGNIGEEAPVYLELGIEQQVWVEANPEICEKLRVNILSNKKAVAICKLVTDEDNKEMAFHISNNGSQSSSVLELGTHLQQHPEVNYVADLTLTSQRLDTILKYLELAYMVPPTTGLSTDNLDFLNIDLQGAEMMALVGLGEKITQFKWIYLEVNRDYVYKNCPLVGEIDAFLAPFGFRRVETKWCGSWGDACFVK